jgi:glycosyltransferase involved in cell wall biosynthesis
MQTDSISVVIPVYNSEQTLKPLVSKLKEVLEKIAREFEVIMVNDASNDDSWSVIEELADSYQFVRGVDMMRNYGQHNALLAGIRQAKYKYTVTIDDDLQHPPAEIVKLAEKIEEGYDVVYGSPQEEQHGLFRDFASQFIKLALKTVMKLEIAREVSAFRIFRTDIRKAFENYSGSYPNIDVFLTWGTKKIAAVKVKHEERKAGVSNYTFGKLLVHAINLATGFSVIPLRIASLLGFIFTVFGFMVLLYVVGRFLLQGSPVAGFPFLASIIAIFSGVQLFSLGIIGEYLARMHYRLMERPTYTIKTSI